MTRAGLRVVVETAAGEAAHFADDAFRDAGADMAAEPAWSIADVILTVRAPPLEAAADLRRGALLIGFLDPARQTELIDRLAAGGVSALALERLPRISRAQAMDALSSQASIAGYKAAVLAAARLGKYFPMLMTAAGTVPPARVVVVGAGVAGLQAIATARRLGAVVAAYDVRPAVQEEVESLGGKFIELPLATAGDSGSGAYAQQVDAELLRRQQEVLHTHVAAADVVLTTAQVPGKPAPRLITADMVRAMRPGSVIVDLAVEQGGNCELSECGREVVRHGVCIIGHPNLPATVAHDASVLYARNVWELLRHVTRDGRLHLDLGDEIVRQALLTHDGRTMTGDSR
jgi:NAD(P) transhydrogenase subunit alpha